MAAVSYVSTTIVPSTDGVHVALHDLGGAGRPLVFCHATGFHGRVWQPVADHLAGRFNCFAIDFRGHGDSIVPDGLRYEWAGMADDLLAVVDHLDDGAVLAAGWSMGGASIMLSEQRRRGTFAGAWLFEPILIPSDGSYPVSAGGPSPLAESARRRREIFDSREAAFDRYLSRPPFSTADEVALRSYVDHGFRDLDDGTVILKCRGEVEASVFDASLTDGFDHLGDVEIPVTVVASGDGLSPALIAPRVVEALPDGRLEYFDDLTHFAPLEDPTQVAASIAAALDPAAQG